MSNLPWPASTTDVNAPWNMIGVTAWEPTAIDPMVFRPEEANFASLPDSPCEQAWWEVHEGFI